MTAYQIPSRLAHVVPDGDDGLPSAVFLMRLPDGPPVVLHDSAAWIWLIAADGEPDVAAAVAELVGRPAAEMADEVNHFLDDLVGRGLIEAVPPRDETSAEPAALVGVPRGGSGDHNRETRAEAVALGAILGEDFDHNQGSKHV